MLLGYVNLLIILNFIVMLTVEGRWHYRGCFLDNEEDRILPHDMSWKGGSLKKLYYERCKEYVILHGYSIIGIKEDGSCSLCVTGDDCAYDRYGLANPCKPSDTHVFTCNKADDVVGDHDAEEYCDAPLPFKCFRGYDAKKDLINILETSPKCRDDSTSNSCYGFYFDPSNRKEQCRNLFQEILRNYEYSSQQEFTLIPAELEQNFTMGGAVGVVYVWPTPSQNRVVWDAQALREAHERNYCFIDPPYQCKRLFEGSYSNANTSGTAAAVAVDGDAWAASSSSLKKHFRGAGEVGGVFGSAAPWLESSLVAAGAAHVITVEYHAITSLVPQISTITPAQVASQYLADYWLPLDFAASFSSFEHTGLGRYGEEMDPAGDLKAMAQLHCLLQPGGAAASDGAGGPRPAGP